MCVYVRLDVYERMSVCMFGCVRAYERLYVWQVSKLIIFAHCFRFYDSYGTDTAAAEQEAELFITLLANEVSVILWDVLACV